SHAVPSHACEWSGTDRGKTRDVERMEGVLRHIGAIIVDDLRRRSVLAGDLVAEIDAHLGNVPREAAVYGARAAVVPFRYQFWRDDCRSRVRQDAAGAEVEPISDGGISASRAAEAVKGG